MHRFYMTAETRQGLIAESNRLIAARAAANAVRSRPTIDSATEPSDTDWSASPGRTESAFDRLVSELLQSRRISTDS